MTNKTNSLKDYRGFLAQDARDLAQEYKPSITTVHQCYRLASVLACVRTAASSGKYFTLVTGLLNLEDVKSKLVERGFDYYHGKDDVLEVRW